MRYLLDTHILIWLIVSPNKLGKQTRSLIQNTHNSLSISAISLFEIMIKSQAGKLSLDLDIFNRLDEVFVNFIPLDIPQIQNYQIYNPANPDPFDNMILAVAQSQNQTLITADAKILSSNLSTINIQDGEK